MRGVLVFLVPSLGSPSIGVFEDHRGAIDLAKNPLSSSNSKRINVIYLFLRELVGKGDSSVKYLRTEDQHAGILTKGIGRGSFWEAPRFSFRDKIICCLRLLMFVFLRFVS